MNNYRVKQNSLFHYSIFCTCSSKFGGRSEEYWRHRDALLGIARRCEFPVISVDVVDTIAVVDWCAAMPYIAVFDVDILVDIA